jgi:molybdopterin converting factor small subunit
MATVWVPSPLRPLCDGANRLEVRGATLDELLRAIDKQCPGFYDRVVEGGRIRPELTIAIDGEAANYPLFEPLRPEADVAIVPAIGGG